MKSAWILFAAMFCANMGHSVLAPVLPPLTRELGLSALQGGLILTCSSIVWVVFCPWWGRRSDDLGRKRVIIIGLAGYGLGAVLFAVFAQAGLDGVIANATLVWLLLVGSRMIVGGMYAAAAPAAQAYIADVSTGQQRTAAMGVVSASNGLGGMLGPALGALVVSLGMSVVAPIFMSSLMPLLGMLLVWRLLPAIRSPLKQGERAPKLNVLDGRLLPLMIIGFCAMLVPAVVTFTLGYLVQDRFGLDAIETASQTGLAVTVSGAALFFAQIVLVQVLRLPPLKLLRLGMPLVLGSVLLLVAVASPLQLMLSMVLMGLGVGMAFPAFRSAVTFAVEPHEQGAVAGLASAMPGYSYIVGPALGTALYGLAPFLPFLLTSVIIVAGIGVLFLHPRTRAVQPAI
ncbi:MAG: MFS transporter [Anaerolineaceae bacterium]|nr:MFS transporter [Anaerolineaceae bacterium]